MQGLSACFRNLVQLCSVMISLLAFTSNTLCQEIDLRGLFKRSERAPDLAVGYGVDPSWPSPCWDLGDNAAVSAVGIDDQRHVWVVTRGRVGVRVFDVKGRLLRVWDKVVFRK